MSDPIARLRVEANVLLNRGQYKRAYECYQQLQKAEPENPEWASRVGELAVSLGDVEIAVAAYARAAELYGRAGQYVKAIAACRYVLDLDPSHTETQTMLGDLFAQSARQRRPSRRTPPPLPPPPEAPLEARRLRDELETRPAASHPSAPEPSAGSDEVLVIELDEELIIEELDASMDEIEMTASAHDGSELSAAAAAATAAAAAATGAAELPEAITTSGARRMDLLPRLPLFSSLPRDALDALIPRLRIERRKAGEVVIREGELDDTMYIVVSGQVEVTRKSDAGDGEGHAPRVLAHLGEGTFFGELGLVTADPRTATVTVTEPSELLALTRTVMGELVTSHPEVLATVLSFVRGRLVATLLVSSPLFTAFDMEDRRALAREFELREMEPGAVVVTQGEKASALHIILAGQVRVDREGMAEPLAHLGAGEVFGEQSLLGAPATASVTVERRAWTLALPRAHFQEVVLARPQLLAFLSDLSDQRNRTNAAHGLSDSDTGGRLTVV
jgi:CRP-like cAMP-binding protein